MALKPPEMIKKRPVIVISPRSRRKNICTVVALSTTTPAPIEPYHALIEFYPKLPVKFDVKDVWVKGDMIYTVSFERLELIKNGRDRSGKRKYYTSKLPRKSFEKVMKCVQNGLAIPC